ncbi:hypothetical protein BDP81DRAFT_456637 [Colletotrichum phormii]|uniref:LysM domain-containing protein n=1 Tax=Colletotrichum phormii TaxID=359342 RepID=A0AAJ0A3I4_9PEZI|nr:uncharacterized protein BDP81DRAFT_456637 [Colletotrichum phormii]KAK1655798.1 hypothetical protein BDP81DRAFT_456637 [Colletotrichum phormii]
MSFFTKVSTALALLVTCSSAFVLWPLVDTEGLSNVLNITATCVTALNATLDCDQDLYQWTVKADSVWWTAENTTQLCTESCLASSRQWKEDVADVCVGEWLRSGRSYVEADTLSGRFAEGLELACTRSSADEWCFVESQTWTGSDVVRPDCAATPADPWCSNPGNVTAENSRMANLYDDDLLCSECFLKLLHTRIESEYLPDEDHSDYLVEQFQDIQIVCQTTLAADISTRKMPAYPTAYVPTPTYGAGPGTVTDTNLPRDPTELACYAEENILDVLVTTKSDDFEACNDVALYNGVATGSILVTTGNSACWVESGEVCGPEPCQLLRVHEGQTCESIATAVSNATDPVNGAQLATWNPNILGACDHLVPDQYICISRPGGSWIPPAIESLPDSSEGPVRGGPGSTPTLEIIDNPLIPIDPWLFQEGIAADCTRYVLASAGANCWKIANDAGVEQSRLFELNPILGASGEFCDTKVWRDYYYCVGVNGEGSPTTTSAPPAAITTSAVPRPTNTQAGQPSECNKWVEAQSGDGCWAMYTAAGIEASQFYAWNPVLGAAGENCGTQIWPTYFYCIGTSSTSSLAPTTTKAADPAKPTATHAGTAADCTEFVQAKAGDGCWFMFTAAGISAELFYKLNPVLGVAGENCGTYVWPDYYYCIAASGSGTVPLPTTTTAGPAKPTTTQAGIDANCNKFMEAFSGDGCWKLANDAGIELSLFYQWNTVVGANGENCGTQIWPQYFYCIGVSS